ncbi:hypothetical protein FB451DRAFT_1522932 [Mycena latifolia]|nr:hypothetical protein FB451DRAFT_1522932 [Mycena latifolia]
MPADPENHFLSLIQPVLQRRADHLVFKPYLGIEDGWGSVTCQKKKFSEHISLSAAHWGGFLNGIGLMSQDVVGLWLTGRLTGKKYEHLINIFGISAAGYVPQLFSVVFPNPEVIWDLLSKSNAKALISFASNCREVTNLPTDLSSRDHHVSAVSQDNIALIVHSFGTTSGTPKPIRTTHGWITAYIIHRYTLSQGRMDDSNVENTIGSLAHVASVTSFLAATYRGYCTAQSAIDMSTEGLMKMIEMCGLNRMAVYATYLSVYIKAAQKDPEVLRALQNFRQIVHAGVALNREDEEWAYANNLPITAMYGTSETASLMTTKLGNSPSDRLLRLMPGGSARLIQYTSDNHTNTPSSSSPQLWEVVLPAGAPDSPYPSLFKDDLYHTGDLFEEVQPGLYAFRGRQDDWLKTVWGLWPSKTMFGHSVRGFCMTQLSLGVRAKVVLFVETTGESSDEACRRLIDEIISRTKPFNARLLAHKRVDNPKQIKVVPKGTFSRNKEKGNVSRSISIG